LNKIPVKKRLQASQLSAEKILERAFRLVTPSVSESRRLERIVAEITERINTTVASEPEASRPQVEVGGSYARGTWLKGSHDVDFFLEYPVGFPRQKLETVAIHSATTALAGFSINKRYAEHPYVESFVDGVRVNLVPCYAVAPGEWQSAADRSPYHTRYIRAKLDDPLRLEARLFKKFAKAIGVYGAEVKIQGFSGYVCEVLTLHFGSFLETLEGVSKIKPAEVLSLEPYDAELAASFQSPIVILDPVDTTRNLGTAISGRNVARLVLASRNFLSRPNLRYFQRTNGSLSRSTISKKSRALLLSRILAVSFPIEPRSPDILWGELKRSSSSLSDKLAALGYQVVRKSAASDEKTSAAFLFLLTSTSSDQVTLRAGPDYFRAEEVMKYFDKNRGKALLTWIGEDGKLLSIFDRPEKLMQAESALAWMLRKENIGGIGISAQIKKELGRRFTISTGLELAKARKTSSWLLDGVVKLASNT
jgi:tRNA nucleotidyltransferase (CCA-adding enzyme)